MLTKKTLADKLDVSVTTINRLLNQGMPKVMVGGSVRFEYEEVVKWLKERGEKR